MSDDNSQEHAKAPKVPYIADRVEALEAALRKIAEWPSSCEEARNIARAALDKDAGK